MIATSSTAADPIKGSGWVLFAGVIVIMAGILNLVWGIAAVGSAAFFVDDASYLLGDLDTWGWVVLAFGVAQILAALSIWRGGAVGRWFGIGVCALDGIATLMSISAYPLWSLAMLALNVLVIYALAAYGGDPRIAKG